MTARKPLFQNNGTVQEIGTGDSVDLAVLGTGTPDSTKYLRGDGTWTTPIASAAPAGNTKEVQFNNAGTTAGAANVEVDNGDLCLIANPSPVTPPTDNVKLFGKKLANRMLLAAVGPSGMDSCLQPAAWRQKVGIWMPPGNTTATPGVMGMYAITTAGNATTRNVATTNLMSRTRRQGYVSATTYGAIAGQFTPSTQFTTGNGTGLGGFFYSCRFAFSDAAGVSGVRAFVGLSSATSAPTNVEPNTLINSVGVAQFSTDTTQLYLVYGGSAAQTAIPLGTGFPPMTAAGATNGVVYDLTLFSPTNENGVIYYLVEKVGTSFVAEGVLTPTTLGVQTPANTTLLAHRAWRCNNATALAVGIDIVSIYIETDY